jgi:hypothetical protein
MDDWLASHERASEARQIAAQVDGRHYSALAPQIKALRQSGDDDAAAGLLLRAIDAIEREAQIPLAGHTEAPPWFFQQLAAIYSKAGDERAAALVRQRHNVLQIRAQTAGLQATAKARAASQASPRPSATAVSAGRAAGTAVRAGAGLLRRLLSR